MKKTAQADLKERELRQNIYQLELKAKQTIDELQRAKKELQMIEKTKREAQNSETNQVR